MNLRDPTPVHATDRRRLHGWYLWAAAQRCPGSLTECVTDEWGELLIRGGMKPGGWRN